MFKYNEFTSEFYDEYNSRTMTVNGIKESYSPYEITGIMMPDGKIFVVENMSHHDALFMAVVSDLYPEIKEELMKIPFLADAFEQLNEYGWVSSIIDKDKIYGEYKVVYMSEDFGVKRFNRLTDEQVTAFNWLYDIGYYSFNYFYNELQDFFR